MAVAIDCVATPIEDDPFAVELRGGLLMDRTLRL
jgi:hypothetical protein